MTARQSQPVRTRRPRSPAFRMVCWFVAVVVVLVIAGETGIRIIKRQRDALARELAERAAPLISKQLGQAAMELYKDDFFPAGRPASGPLPPLFIDPAPDKLLMFVDVCGAMFSGAVADEQARAAADSLGWLGITFPRAVGGPSRSRPAGTVVRLRPVRPATTLIGSTSGKAGDAVVTLLSADCSLRDEPDSQSAEALSFTVHLRLRIERPDSDIPARIVEFSDMRGWVHASGSWAWCRAYGPDGAVLWQGQQLPGMASTPR